MLVPTHVRRLVNDYRTARDGINALVERILDPDVSDQDAPSDADIRDARLALHTAALALAQAVSYQVDEQYDAEVTAGRIREVTAG